MKLSIRKFAFAAVLLTASLHGHAAGPTDALAAFHAALAGGDTTKAQGFLDAQLAVFESGHVERSRSEYVNHHLPADIGFAQSTKRKVVQHAMRNEGNLAVIWEETETTGTFKGKPVHLLGTETAVLEKKGDQWTITHVHWSSRQKK